VGRGGKVKGKDERKSIAIVRRRTKLLDHIVSTGEAGREKKEGKKCKEKG